MRLFASGKKLTSWLKVEGTAISIFDFFFFFSILCRAAFNAAYSCGGAVAQWLECRTGDRVVLGSNPAGGTSLRNFGNSVYPTLPVYFGGYTKSRRSLVFGVYARGSKIPHTAGAQLCGVFYFPWHRRQIQGTDGVRQVTHLPPSLPAWGVNV